MERISFLLKRAGEGKGKAGNRKPRADDICYSFKDIQRGKQLIPYVPQVEIKAGWGETVAYFMTPRKETRKR